ncbi:VOC family protein [Hydrogenophaga sp. PAMC20947]|uniref:VOC family protein n=1 Tax=Hydrogenophaga sp. PAMC20947 TaxID=2565558 RepID=UPI001B353CF4|nr:VOC family protein [Hydrogenophaga sp. PAMC20947]
MFSLGPRQRAVQFAHTQSETSRHILKLDHINVRTTQLGAMVEWYTRVLGLRVGDRPNFPFPGAWLYAGDTMAVHLVGIDGATGTGSEMDLKLEHFAFTATGLAEFENTLQGMGETSQRTDLRPIDLVQINLWDPDGNHLHVDFSGES